MSIEKNCHSEEDKEWLEARKAKHPKQHRVRKSKSKGKGEKFIERQTENELEDLAIKTAFSIFL